MSTVTLNQSVVTFAGYPPGSGAVQPQVIPITVTAPVTVTIAVSGPDASAFPCTMISNEILVGIHGGGGVSTTQLGTTATIAPPSPTAVRPPIPMVQVGFNPGTKAPAVMQATLTMSWAGGSLELPLSGACSQFTAATNQPLRLVAGADNVIQMSLKYVALDPAALPVQLSQTMTPLHDTPLHDTPIPDPSAWLQIASGATTLPVPAPVAGERDETVNLAVSTLDSLGATGKGYGYVVVTLPTQAALAPGGPVEVEVDVSAIYVKWQSLDTQKNASGGSVRDYLGYSLGGESAIDDAQGGGTVQYFQRGMIVARKDGKTVVVYGAIYVKYRALGGLGSALGQPTDDEKDAGQGGRVSAFDKGDIYWTSALGAHAVHGAIRDRYNALKGPDGVLGFPSSSEIELLQDQKTTGSHNRFANDGVIYWTQETGAWEVYGPIRDAWEDDYKGVAGTLGLPIAAQGEIQGNAAAGVPNTKFGSFQGGALVWQDSGANKGTNVVTALNLFVERFSGSGTHGAFEELGASVWLYVNVTIQSSEDPVFTTKIPAGNDQSNPVVTVDAPIYGVAKVRGDLVLNVSFAAFDRKAIGSDDPLGTITQLFTAQNLWGLNQPQSITQGQFTASFGMQTPIKYDPAKFRQEMWWGFDNQGTPDLSWAEYADTFSDVPTNPNVVFHLFDSLFYSLVFKGLAANGNCVGFCLASIYSQIGRSLFNEPIVRFPWDAPEIQEVNIKMGYQLGADFIDWFLGQFIAGNTHDPNGVWNASKASFESGDYPVIVLSDNEFWGEGHCVRPYKFYDVGEYTGKESSRVILVGNPDAPGVNWTNNGGGTAVPDNSDACVIVIDPKANTYTFTKAQGSSTVYNGGDWSGGRMLSVPFHLFSYVPRTPFWEALALLVAGTLMICSGDAQTQQVTDGDGKTFYDPTLKTPPSKWTDIVKDGNQRPKMTCLPTYGDADAPASAAVTGSDAYAAVVSKITAMGHIVATESKPEVYYLHGDGGTLKHDLVGTKNGKVQWHMKSAATQCVLTLDSVQNAIDSVEVGGVGARSSTVKVTTALSGSARAAVLSLSSGDAGALFTVDALTLTPGQPITFGLSQSGRELSVQNGGPQATCNLTVTDTTGAAKTHAGIALASGRTIILSINSSATTVTASVPLHMQVLEKVGGNVLSESDLV